MQTLTLRTRLDPTPEQADALQETLERFAQACNLTLEVARACKTFSKFKLQRLVYGQLRALGLSANLAIRAIARVGHRKGHRAKHYRPTSCDYDQRTLSLRGERVSLSTTRGRLRIPMRLSPYHRHWLARARSVQGGAAASRPTRALACPPDRSHRDAGSIADWPGGGRRSGAAPAGSAFDGRAFFRGCAQDEAAPLPH